MDSRAFGRDASNYLTIEEPKEIKDKGRTTRTDPGLRVLKNRNGQKGGLLPIVLDGPRFFGNQAERVTAG